MNALYRTFWLLILPGSLLAQMSQAPADVIDAIDRIVEPYVLARNFMGAIAVASDGNRPVMRSYGLANVEKSIENDVSGQFMIGSISKQFTAAAVLLLAEDGKMSTDDLVARHLPDFPHGNRVTVHQLLTHTSGIADTYSLAAFRDGGGTSGEFSAIIGDLGRAPLTQDPGAGFSYSNGGYLVLAAIIERVSGTSYGSFLAERIFGPLDMNSTSHDAPAPAGPSTTVGYHPLGANDLSPKFPQSTGWSAGAGSIWSTAGDMLRWSEALHGGELLRAESYARMTNDYGNEYGYGVSVFSRFGKRVVGHDGRVSGYASDLARYLDEQLTVVVLSNVESVARDEIRVDVARAWFGDEAERREGHIIASQSIDPGPFVGVYRFGPNFTVTARAENERLLVRANEGDESELVLQDGTRFFSRMLYADVCFGQNETGTYDRLIWGCSENSPVGIRED